MLDFIYQEKNMKEDIYQCFGRKKIMGHPTNSQILNKLDIIERKIDDLIALREYDSTMEISSYSMNGRFCTLFKTPAGTYGINMKEHGNTIGRELFPGKSESFAEDAAENFVQGIKN